MKDEDDDERLEVVLVMYALSTFKLTADVEGFRGYLMFL